MRTNIYYWKCDSPLSAEEKRRYNEKYSVADITPIVTQIANDYFASAPDEVFPAGGQGNHYTYIISYADREIFFRSDDGCVDDDYIEAESAIMQIVAARGIPVPKVHHYDATCTKYPLRFQLMEKIDARPLCEYHQDDQLNLPRIAKSLGEHIAKLHTIQFDGFGFINTELLQQTGEIVGLDSSSRAFFNKRLEDHLEFMANDGFLSAAEISEIRKIFNKYDDLLQIPNGSLVHKDLALWNVLGNEQDITAIIDWDDVIIGDPVDDLAILKCFYDDEFLSEVLVGYENVTALPDAFEKKLNLYLIRNMLWKVVIRTIMNYFDMDDQCFINQSDRKMPLREFSYNKIIGAIEALKN